MSSSRGTNLPHRYRTKKSDGYVDKQGMPDSLYGARLQGFTVVVFIVAKSRAWHDSLQARAIEGIGH